MSESPTWTQLARQMAMLERLLDLADDQTALIAESCGSDCVVSDGDPLVDPAFAAAIRHLVLRSERLAGAISELRAKFFRPC